MVDRALRRSEQISGEEFAAPAVFLWSESGGQLPSPKIPEQLHGRRVHPADDPVGVDHVSGNPDAPERPFHIRADLVTLGHLASVHLHRLGRQRGVRASRWHLGTPAAGPARNYDLSSHAWPDGRWRAQRQPSHWAARPVYENSAAGRDDYPRGMSVSPAALLDFGSTTRSEVSTELGALLDQGHALRDRVDAIDREQREANERGSEHFGRARPA